MTFIGHLYPFRFPNRIRNVGIKDKVSSMPWNELWLFVHQFSRKLISRNDVNWTSPLSISFFKSDTKCSNYGQGFFYAVE